MVLVCINKRCLLILISIITFAAYHVTSMKSREEKMMPLFRVIRFPNQGCSGSGSKNGTCYTAVECKDKGGAASGSCANGFGVCCVFAKGCGSSSAENCTYFGQSDGGAGTCKTTICPCSTRICQIRLDFETFVITGPSTSTDIATSLLSGNPNRLTVGVANQAIDATVATQCLTDTFHITSPGGPTPPVICGTNTGDHLYIDASPACNDFVFTFGRSGIGATLATRAFSIKITQYNCLYDNLAPSGCTQWHFGSSTGTVRTFNFASSKHLANQAQHICIRRERDNCRICWHTVGTEDFAVSKGRDQVRANPNACCGYGDEGINQDGYDCVQIPGLQKVTGGTAIGFSRLCGQGAGLISVLGQAVIVTKTLCSTRTPFEISFYSDNWEFMKEATTPATKNSGFRLDYVMDAINC